MSDLKSRAIPYGYKMVNGIVTVNEEEANIVLKIFADRLEGVGVYAIGKALYESQCKQYNKLYQFPPPKLYRSSPQSVPTLATKRTTVIYCKQ